MNADVWIWRWQWWRWWQWQWLNERTIMGTDSCWVSWQLCGAYIRNVWYQIRIQDIVTGCLAVVHIRSNRKCRTETPFVVISNNWNRTYVVRLHRHFSYNFTVFRILDTKLFVWTRDVHVGFRVRDFLEHV